MSEVGAIPQGRGLDRNNGDHTERSFRVWLVVRANSIVSGMSLVDTALIPPDV
jgi:hypothetical protein